MAFAVATAGSGNPPDLLPEGVVVGGPPGGDGAGVGAGGGGGMGGGGGDDFRDAAKRKCSITSNVSTMRVLSVLRHWVAKHTQVR